uniref:Uncharacterized protein n=1 Tax=Anguilla anguilla TaxID=7936 RepID=A0A0E9XR80_ANGAN
MHSPGLMSNSVSAKALMHFIMTLHIRQFPYVFMT